MSGDVSTHPAAWARYGVVALYVGGLVAASVVPSSGGLVAPGPLGVVGSDKWLHFAGYAGLGAVTAAALRARTRRSLAVAALFALVVGTGVEAVQATLPYRTADAVDGLANAAGATLGVACWLALSTLAARVVPERGDRD